MGRFHPGCTSSTSHCHTSSWSIPTRVWSDFASTSPLHAFHARVRLRMRACSRIPRPRASPATVRATCHVPSSCTPRRAHVLRRVCERLGSNLRPPSPSSRAPCRPGDAPWACADSCRRISRTWKAWWRTQPSTTAVFRVRHAKQRAPRSDVKRTRWTWKRSGWNRKRAKT